MQLWFEALLGIFNARFLRLDDFFPSGHLEAESRFPARISSLQLRPYYQKYSTQMT